VIERVGARSGASLSVAVLAGGRSSEHEVSLSSAAAVRDGRLAAGHRVQWIEISRDGAWLLDGQTLSVTPGAGLAGVDVVFPVLHGPFGEDGTVQGLLESLDVAYVGAGVAASAVCLDKVMFKRLMGAYGIPQVAYAGLRAEHFEREREPALEKVRELGLPVFVKPAHLGSSVGIAKVSAPEQLEDALERAFAHDELVIVEAFARGLEVECGVLGALDDGGGGGQPLSSQPGQITYSGDFYDYEAKYTPGGMELLIPATISAAATARVRELSLEVFAASGCEGLARIDFFVDGEDVLVNELNTMPGFTPTSVYAKLLAATGVPYELLVDRLCRLGYERWERRRRYVN
jgi:D-alanine-D-alanine ligase